MLIALFVGLLALGTVHALPDVSNNGHLIHESAHARQPRWEKRTELPDRDSKFPMRIALMQRNLHQAEALLMQVSHPGSSTFGQYWTPERVADAFAPSDESLMAVAGWLVDSGISKESISVTPNRGSIVFNITIGEAEDLLHTKYYQYSDSITGKAGMACDHYSVPREIRPHIDFITPTVTLHSPRQRRRRRTGPSIAQPLHPKPGLQSLEVSKLPATDDLSNCDTAITPDCLRALYNIPRGTSAHPNNSLGIYAQSPDEYLQADLDVFFRNFTPELVGRPPNFVSIDGGAKFNSSYQFQLTTETAEGDLDLMYSMALSFPLNVSFYQVGDINSGGNLDLFLDALDGSFCTYEGGDPSNTPSYPDPLPHGFNQTRSCGGAPIPKIISVSYEGDEIGASDLEKDRMCHEFMKLGLMGVSVFFASGDAGVAGNSGCLDPATDGTTFNPEFPATCPYITAVGGTQVNTGSSVSDPESVMEAVTISGGGFSNFFAMPDYQKEAVLAWFEANPSVYNSTTFNNTRQARGYPDVAFNGVNYLVGVAQNPPYIPNDKFGTVSGTSASCPAFAATIALINEARLNAGKTTVGFINPVIYAHPDVFNDITSGSNPGCGTIGFNATKGWDPVTGLGTPKFPELFELYLSLP
ncbi:peptidase S8/S53 domain-containing protein [Xylogone sp. PMI_703]|nr:peptidase S8/S53 domain-containing protein [Xylogone sp. PMI_703]